MRRYYEEEARRLGHHQRRMYHPSNIAHRLRLREVLDTMQKAIRDGQLMIDVGCGEGFYLDHAFRSGLVTVGVDISVNYLKRVDRKHHVVLADGAHLPFRQGIFEVTLCSEVLEHTPNPEKCVAELAWVTSKSCLVSCPLTARRKPFGNQRAEEREKQFHGHISNIHVDDLQRWFESQAFGLSTMNPVTVIVPIIELLNTFARLIYPRPLEDAVRHFSLIFDRIRGLGSDFTLPFFHTTAVAMFIRRTGESPP